MGMIKNRTDKDLTETEEVNKVTRGDKNTQNYTGKVLMSQKTMMPWSHT